MTQTFTLYKLIILYLLDNVDFPLTTSQISGFILEEGYTTYFRIQETLAELAGSGLLRTESTKNRTLYHLTDAGAETIHFFHNKISPAIRNDIKRFLDQKKYELKEESSVKADYFRNADDEYEVRCQLVEDGRSLIDLKLTVPTEKEAQTIASNWNKSYQDIYAALLARLL